MRLRVREQGDEIHVEVDGIAGRQHYVLQALAECQRRTGVLHAPSMGDVRIRAGADRMRIRLKGRDGLRFEASAIYVCLREALIGRSTGAGAPTPAA